MAEKSKRDTTQEAIVDMVADWAMVADWERSDRLALVKDLLNELDDDAIAKIAKQQGVTS